jgi:hypothetical protein
VTLMKEATTTPRGRTMTPEEYEAMSKCLDELEEIAAYIREQLYGLGLKAARAWSNPVAPARRTSRSEWNPPRAERRVSSRRCRHHR